MHTVFIRATKHAKLPRVDSSNNSWYASGHAIQPRNLSCVVEAVRFNCRWVGLIPNGCSIKAPPTSSFSNHHQKSGLQSKALEWKKMMFQRERRSSATLLVCSLLTVHAIALVSCQDISTMQAGLTPGPAVEYTCTPECEVGYECEYGRCIRQQCSRNCSGVAVDLVCGSNGVTYNNLCEVKRARCELAYDILVEHPGACITAPPPPDQNCSAHQARYDDNTVLKSCDFEKYINGTLDQSELNNCYRPQCNHHSGKYLIKQCIESFLTPQWCWCSTSDGYAIQGTFQMNMPYGYCSNRRKCVVNGRTYNDGAVFTPSNVCGRCNCLNGTSTCFVEFDVDSSGRLSNDSLEMLKTDLIQAFNYQYNHRDHAVDIRYVYKYPTEVSDSQKEILLDWKFNHYDKDQDDELSISNKFNFLSELLSLFGCNWYFDHLSELLDENGDKVIIMKEWKDFFRTIQGADDSPEVSKERSQPVKREATPRKPLHLRKKFHYLLY